MTTKQSIGKKDFIFNDKPPQFDSFIDQTTNLSFNLYYSRRESIPYFQFIH